jgi:hypothetical protein
MNTVELQRQALIESESKYRTRVQGAMEPMNFLRSGKVIGTLAGGIDIRSAPGKGTRVRVWLPAAAAEPQVADPLGGPAPALRRVFSLTNPGDPNINTS